MKVALVILASLFGLVVVGLVACLMWIGISMASGRVPDTLVVKGRDLKPATREAIEKIVPLRPGERIEFFYSTGFWSFEEDGNLITNQRVVSYCTLDEGEMWIEQAEFDEIESIAPIFSDNWIDDTEVTIYPKGREDFFIWLSTEEGIDREAVDYLVGRGLTVGSDDEPTAGQSEEITPEEELAAAAE